MPRKLRVEYEEAIYHLMNRGDRRESIFLGDPDRELFVQMLGEACQKTGWQVHALCLMSNHFHLVVETPRANLVAGLRWRYREGALGGTAAGGDDDDVGLDSTAVGNGTWADRSQCSEGRLEEN